MARQIGEMMKTKNKKLKTKLERVEKYWICDECVIKKHPDWIYPIWPITVTIGLCGHCKRKDKTILTPIVDFARPGKLRVWD